MFNLGAPEVLVIMVLALIVLGPQRLPDAARQVGKAMAEVRKMSSGFQKEIKAAFDDDTETAARAKGAAAVAGSSGVMPEAAPIQPAPIDAMAADAEGIEVAAAEPAPRAPGAHPMRSTPLQRPAAKRPAAAKKAAAKKASPAKKAAAKKASPAKKAAAKKAAPRKKAP